MFHGGFWHLPLQFSIETFLRGGSYSFQAKEDCILVNLELVKTIVELEKKLFSLR